MPNADDPYNNSWVGGRKNCGGRSDQATPKKVNIMSGKNL